MNKDRVEYWKNIAAIWQSVATVIALCIGGYWALHNFGLQRQEYPKLKIEQRIRHLRVSREYNLLIVDHVLSNVGPVLLQLQSGEIRLVKLVPLPSIKDQELHELLKKTGHHSEMEDPDTWNLVERRVLEWQKSHLQIEPGETDQLRNMFLIPSTIRTITVAAYFPNPSNQSIGWRIMDFYDFTEADKSVRK